MLIGIIQLCSHSEPSHRSRVVRRKAHDIMASALRLKAGGSSLRLLGKNSWVSQGFDKREGT